MAGVVFQIAKADAHVVMNVVGDGDGETHAQDSVRESERVEVAIAQKESAGASTPDEGEPNQQWVGDVGDREEDGRESNGRGAAHAKADEPEQNVNLQNELLHQRPYRVAENVNGDRQRSVERVQGL